MSRRRPIVHAFCCYCRRTLSRADSGLSTAATRDHVMPESQGGEAWVPCCVTCNELKGDILPDDWWWIVRTVPRFWRIFGTHQQVKHAIQQEHVRRVYVNAGKERPWLA